MKLKFNNKSLLSWLLSFAMIIGLLSGSIIVKETSKAAPVNRTIKMGSKEIEKGYYYYPKAEIDSEESSERYQYLTVAVDSGYLTVTDAALNGVVGQGIIYGDNLDVGFTEIKAAEKYEAINFDLGDKVVRKNVMDAYIQSVRFTTEASRPQKVTITATTRSDIEPSAHIKDKDGKDTTFSLHYFNGHYYGYVDMALTGTNYSWNEAYKLAQDTTFYGIKGYLATLTSRAEDRFIYEKFKGDGIPPRGWLGCTRAGYVQNTDQYTDVKDVVPPQRSWGTDAETLAKDVQAIQSYLKECREKKIWNWVTGPEKGQAFGYQNLACGDGLPNKHGTDDGGFVTYDGFFSNWNDSREHAEPNGAIAGVGTGNEAYGYYGEYQYGRWNDHKDNDTKGFYIEFAGCDGDAEKLEIEGEHFVYTQTEDSNAIITDEDTYGKVFNPGPFIRNDNVSGNTAVGTELTADTSKIDFIDYPGKDTISYQWFIVNDDGTMEPIEEAIVKDGKSVVTPANDVVYTLTENTFGKKLAVRVTETDPNGKVVGVGTSAPYETGDGVAAIHGTVLIVEDSITGDGQLVVKADISGVKPADAHKGLDYQWYEVDAAGNRTKIPGATGETYTIPKEYQDKDLIVVVTPDPGSDYTGEIPSDPYHVKELITGKPVINADGDNVKGTVLSADISEIGPKDANFKENDFNYQWYVVNENGTRSPIPGATKSSYTLTDNTVDENIVVSTTVKPENPKYSGIVYSDPYDDKLDEKTPIKGKPAINQVDSVLTAVVTDITPKEAQPVLEYQWYDDGVAIPGATSKTLELTDALLDGSKITVQVKVPENNTQYTGSADSDPLVPEKKAVEPEKIPIKGAIKIENQTKDDEGNPVNREGTILFAGLDNVTPNGCHNSLSYQWYVLEVVNGEVQATPIAGATNQNYALTKDTVDKTVAVIATADGKTYVGSVSSDPYDATRTNSGVEIEKPSDPGASEVPDGKQIIYVTPTEEDTKYKITEINGTIPKDMEVIKIGLDGKETDIKDTIDKEGFYIVDPGETIKFVVAADENYVIREEQIKRNNTDITSQDVPDVKAEQAKDGTITITVDPAKTDTKYAVLKKNGDAYVPVTVTKGSDGYAYAPNSQTTWSDSGESVVTFTKLPADGTYKIVAVSATNIDGTYVDPNSSPDQLLGGSKDIVGSEVKPGNNTTQTFTKEEQAKADKLIKDFITNPKDGKVVTEINDYTRDVVINGEKTWNTLTKNEKAAVNAKLKELGCKYTYEQLLAMAKKWQIPYFKINKVMKKGTKSKLKLIKCNGATVIASSTNNKVATISKKGVIKAKKPGKANCTITVVKGNYSNRLVIKVVVRKKFKNAKELKKFKSSKIKTPTILLNKQRKLKKSTKIKIYGLAKGSKVSYKSLNKKVVKINKKGKYTAKKKGNTLIRATVKQNGKKYLLYLYVTAHK